MRPTDALVLSAALLAGCSVAAPTGKSSQAQHSAPVAALRTWHLPWGAGPEAVGLRAAAPESLAEGPSSIAVVGDALAILDRRNERVIGLDGRGVVTRAVAPPDAELLASADDGALAMYSVLRSHIWLVDAAGAPLGELAVPREVRDIAALSVGGSRRIELTTALQDTLPLGSPRFPLALPVVLASREEGAARVGVARVRVVKDQVGLHLERVEPRGERRAPISRLLLKGADDAAQLIGVDGHVACVRTESLAGGSDRGAIEVVRRAVCVDLDDGQERLAVDLPAPGIYLPRQELAVGGGRLAFMHPTDAGLDVSVWAISAGGAR